MAGFFDLPSTRSTTKRDQKLLNSAKPKSQVASPTAVRIKGNGKLSDKIEAIISLVDQKFPDKDAVLLIQDEQDLVDYIDACIKNSGVAIDTETTGKDPIIDKIVGFSLYTPGQKAAYVPINHKSYITGFKYEEQLPIDVIKRQLSRLIIHNVKTYWFNAPFDIRVIENNIGIRFTAYFDGYIAAMCLNSDEPEGQRGLKPLHKKYCWGNRGEALSFGKLFDDIPFDLIPIKTAYLYAASDAIYTWELCQFQAQYLEPDGIYYESKNMQKVSNVFFNIEMKVMPTFIDMEQLGVEMDYEHAEKISKKYHDLESKMEENLRLVGEQYMNEINDYRRRNPACKLSDPVNFESNAQLATILYDILKIEPVDPKKPRSVDKEALAGIDHPLCEAIRDIRAFRKVISTYIDKLPEVSKMYPDKRLHCSYNQYGAETGRVSSKFPNMQNIPSRPFKLSDGTKIDSGHDIRQLFRATPGYILMSCDYSGQEPRVTAHLSQDQKMIQAYRDGKDVYSEIAALAFDTTYEECCERKDGEYYPEGAARRSESKRIVLGILYGRGIPSIAEQLKKTVEEAQAIYDKVLDNFEGLAQFIVDSEDMAREYGYTETVWGRRRQLPDMQLPWYEFTYKSGVSPDFDPLSDSPEEASTEVPEDIVEALTNKLLNCWSWKRREAVKDEIRSYGIDIKDNTALIKSAKRQCVNARVQGSAADLTKLAQIELYNNKELRDLGFRMLIPVHDEVIAECPIENVKRCAELMSACMKHAGRDLCVPLDCDVALFYNWYGEEIKIEDL